MKGFSRTDVACLYRRLFLTLETVSEFALLSSLLITLTGCKIAPQSKSDGLYINYKLNKPQATVEDFCRAEGSIVELIRNNKVILSKSVRKE